MAESTGGPLREMFVEVPSKAGVLKGILGLPSYPRGVVLFAHGSGSSRFSPRNSFVARVLQEGGIATLLMDLLTEEEAEDRTRVFDIDLLTDRLLEATAWVRQHPVLGKLPVAYFGASTGAAAALKAAAREGSDIVAVVSRGGRPDLAGDALPRVASPTLLIVGGNDEPVVELNEDANNLLPGVSELVIVPGATHLFEEPGALEQVARLARDWLQRYMPQPMRKAA
ncbi:MAG: dienelactone hydrolase family protein [Chloroflexota bacterium]